MRRSLSLYDANGNLVKLERQADAGAAQWQKTEYEYDILDHLVAVKQYLTQNAILDTRYEYDANENRSRVVDAENHATVYQYDEREFRGHNT